MQPPAKDFFRRVTGPRRVRLNPARTLFRRMQPPPKIFFRRVPALCGPPALRPCAVPAPRRSPAARSPAARSPAAAVRQPVPGSPGRRSSGPGRSPSNRQPGPRPGPPAPQPVPRWTRPRPGPAPCADHIRPARAAARPGRRPAAGPRAAQQRRSAAAAPVPLPLRGRSAGRCNRHFEFFSENP